MKRIIIFGLMGILIAIAIGLSIYHKPHKNMSKTKPDVTISALDLSMAYIDDEQDANDQFLGKVVEVTGAISEIEVDNDIIVYAKLEGGDLMTSVHCDLDESEQLAPGSLSVGNTVTLRCDCTGKLMDVELNRCVLVK